MFNSNLKKEALEKFKNATENYNNLIKSVNNKSIELFQLRLKSSEEVIQNVERYINNLSNSPKEFDKAVSELKFSFSKFNSVLDSVTKEAEKTATIAGRTAGAGALAGVGFAAAAPTAAMAVATTFGAASTGTAIASLSGAAATNAALAWLGGGALAAGGGGMAAGNAFLALAGPIGWTIGGVSLIGSSIWASSKNKETAEKANTETIKVNQQISAFQTIIEEINKLIKLTKQHAEGAMKQLQFLINNAPDNYKSFNSEQKQEIMSLVNNIQSLSKLLSKTVGN